MKNDFSDSCLGNVEQNDSRKIYLAKAPRTPSSEIEFILFLCGLCVFARDIPRLGCG